MGRNTEEEVNAKTPGGEDAKEPTEVYERDAVVRGILAGNGVD
jgi:hypothetical protein